jgi:NADPH2:quinone reductase
MKAVVCRQYGLAHARIEDCPSLPLKSGEVRIGVRAAGVSFANLLVIDGKHQNRADPPFTPGTEISGVVLECAPDVDRFRPGDRVVAGIRRGGFAEEAIAPVQTVFALPDAIDFAAGSHFPTLYATAYAALRWRAALQPGETLLVHGAAGGSGLAAIEIGKVLGARVIATAGSAEKLAAVRAHGADLAIHHREQIFREVVLEATDGRGADVIFDPVGGSFFTESLRCIAPEGRLLPIGFAGGDIPQIPANLVLVKNVSVLGVYWGYYMGWAHQTPPASLEPRRRAAFDELLAWATQGRLRPQTHRIEPLTRFREALEALSAREVIGRCVLQP